MGIQNASWSFLRRPETWVIQNVTIEIYIYILTVNAAIACRISRYSCTCNEIRATHLKGVFEHATTQTLHGYSKNCNYNRNCRAGKMRQDWKASHQIKVCRTVRSAKNGKNSLARFPSSPSTSMSFHPSNLSQGPPLS